MARKRRKRIGDGLYLRNKTWWLGCTINGVRHQLSIGKGITRSVARELANVKRTAILKDEAGIGGKKVKDLLFEEAVKRFLDWAKADKKPNTVRIYEACLVELGKEFSGKQLGQITPWLLEAYKKRRGEGMELTERPADVSDQEWARRCRIAKKGAPVRCNRELATLRALVNRCRDWRLFEGENPVSKIKFKKEPRTRVRFLESDEEARLLAACQEPLRTLLLVCIYTGVRLHAEALTLKWPSVDVKRGNVSVEAGYAKNGRSRTVPLNSLAKAALATLQQRAVSDYVFAQSNGSPYRSIRTAFQTACRKAGLSGITPHVLRHTFASRLMMTKADTRTIQELGGWQTIGMVERYSYLSPSHKAEAVEKIVGPFCDNLATLKPPTLAVVS